MSDLVEGPKSNLKAGVDYPTVQQLKKRIAELESKLREAEIHKKGLASQFTAKIEQLESDLAGCIKLIAKYESERDE